MKSTPASKATQAADIIKEAIAAGEWKHDLPSERTLASELRISRSCLRQALKNLTDEGIVTQATQSRRRKILKLPSSKIDSPAQQVIFLTPKLELEATIPTLIQIAELRNILGKSGHTVTTLSPTFYNHQHVKGSSLRKFTDNYPGAKWVLHQSPQHVQRWFDQESIPAVILGSRFPDISIPNIDVDLQSACRHATGHLLAQGHHRLGLIRFRTHLAGDDFALQGMTEAIAANPQHNTIPAPTIIEHNFHSDNLATTLNNLYSTPTPPTALIAVNDHHFISTFTHLMHRGLRIPEDVSMICLTDNPELKHFQPLPTYYSSGQQRIKAIARHLLNPSVKSSILVVPEMIQGKSVAKKA